jgi:hypothetical protein
MALPDYLSRKSNIRRKPKVGTVKEVEVWSQACRSTVSERQDRPLVDRDLNAALNIRLVALSDVQTCYFLDVDVVCMEGPLLCENNHACHAKVPGMCINYFFRKLL